MKLCTSCKKLTPGDPMFCMHCGKSYDYKLCPARHVNPRNALVCSVCGSRDLSVPQRKTGWWLKILLHSVRLATGLLLLLLSFLVLINLLQAVIANQQLMGRFFIAGLLVALLWLVYVHLPRSVQKIIGTRHKPSKGSEHGRQ